MSEQTPVLEARNLRVWYGTDGDPVRAVDGISFDVFEGETLGLVGESGSGKSLTCRSVMRLVPRPGVIAGGRVSFDGRDVLALPEPELRALSRRPIKPSRSELAANPRASSARLRRTTSPIWAATAASRRTPCGSRACGVSP